MKEEGLFPAPPTVFIDPAWLETWWRFFGSGSLSALLAVRQNGQVTGLAPLMIRGENASFMGSPDVCDYLDFYILPGEAERFTTTLLHYLLQNGVRNIDLHSLRPDSSALAGLCGAAEALGLTYTCTREAVSVGLKLPASWEDYLGILAKKQRHEVRRKLRRLEEAGPYNYRIIKDDAALGFIPTFLKMFTRNPDKAAFLAGAAAGFFPAALKAAVQCGWGCFGVLELEGRVASAVFYFDYRGSYYLYNSAYEPDFNALSAGLLCKVLNIKDALARGRRLYDFLKGGEEYKYRLGGHDTPIYRCTVTLPGCRSDAVHGRAGN